MPVRVVHGQSLATDPGLRAIAAALDRYLAEHPGATAELYRRGEYLVRVRVTDPQFAGMRPADREDAVWSHLTHLPDEVSADITFLVAVAPGEVTPASREFDDPTPLTGGVGLFITGQLPTPTGEGLSITGAPPASAP